MIFLWAVALTSAAANGRDWEPGLAPVKQTSSGGFGSLSKEEAILKLALAKQQYGMMLFCIILLLLLLLLLLLYGNMQRHPL